MRYFDHDTDAAVDSKVMSLRIFHGGAAVDCYYAIVESIYREEKPMPADDFSLACLAAKLNATMNQVTEWIDGMLDVGLLEKGKLGYTSKRIEAGIEAYNRKVRIASKAGKASAAKRKKSKDSTVVERSLNGRSTIKREYKESFNKDSLYISSGNAEQSSARHYLADAGGNGAKEGAAAASEGWEDLSEDIDEFLRSLTC